MTNNLELLNFGYEGMLSDGGSAVIDKLYRHILERPTKLVSYGLCTASGGSYGDCVVKLGQEICKETADPELCEMVSKAEIVNDAAKALIKNDKVPATVPQVDISTHLNSLVNEFSRFDCSALSEEQKDDLVNRLNSLENSFISQGRQSEFNRMIKKLSCNVVNEFKCGGKDATVTEFEVAPICKPKFITTWGKPLAIGGVTGVGVGIAWKKIARGSTTLSVLIGIAAGAGTTYYIKKKTNQGN